MSNTKHARPKKMKYAQYFDASVGEVVEIRCMSVCEGWAMVRRPGYTPFIVRADEITPRR